MHELLQKANELKQTLIDWRRYLHQHPELGFEETNTSLFVVEKLTEAGILDIRKMAATGIVAVIRGEEPGPTIMLRADMDALPIQDEKEVPYASKFPGKAHLCGHDAHTTILLGAAILLMRKGLDRGNVKLIFQPAEEGLAGAKAMVEAGVLTEPQVEAVAGLHVNPSIPVGHIAVCPGPCTAFSNRFHLIVKGKGGHAAHPHLSVDSVTVAAEVVGALQQVISRQLDPLSPAVLTIGKISGGYARNVIAPEVAMEGTVRCLDRAISEQIREKMEQIIKGVCDGFGATYQFDYQQGYPAVVNEPKLIPLLQQTTEDVLGENHFSIIKPSMGGEDFSYYTEQVPGVFFRLGVRNEAKGIIYPNHHPLFDIDEEALPIGAAMLAQFALHYLQHSS